MSDEPEPLTSEEKSAIRKLRNAAKGWPKSLWLFSAAGELYVMKKNADGKRQMEPGTGGIGAGGGVDPEFVIGQIEIENDGGDW